MYFILLCYLSSAREFEAICSYLYNIHTQRPTFPKVEQIGIII